RRKVRRIRLDHQPIPRHDPGRIAQRSGVAEGQNSRERDVKPQVEEAARRGRIAREAVDYSTLGAKPFLGHDRGEPFFRIAAVDHDRLSRLAGEAKVIPERAFLRIDRRSQVVKIESALAYRGHLRGPSEASQHRDAVPGALGCIVRMHSHDGVDVGVALRDLNGPAVVFDGTDRADGDNSRDARLRRAGEDSLELAVEPGIGEMAVGVDYRPHSDGAGDQACGFAILGNSAAGGLTRWPGLRPWP